MGHSFLNCCFTKFYFLRNDSVQVTGILKRKERRLFLEVITSTAMNYAMTLSASIQFLKSVFS